MNLNKRRDTVVILLLYMMLHPCGVVIWSIREIGEGDCVFLERATATRGQTPNGRRSRRREDRAASQ